MSILSLIHIYQEMQLDGVVNFEAFEQAITGYHKIEDKTKEILTLVDFSKPSTEERFYVFDMRHKKLLFSSLVSHGKNSGGNYATSFSNENGSLKSSLEMCIRDRGCSDLHLLYYFWAGKDNDLDPYFMKPVSISFYPLQKYSYFGCIIIVTFVL